MTDLFGSRYLGERISTSTLIPKGTIMRSQSEIFLHPVTYLRLMHPKSSVWSERTAGHRELRRMQRKNR
jgi:hypothetical protein